MAQGFDEVLDEDYLQYRIRSVAYLGEHLLAAGVQIVEPPGGHAIYIDAAAFCPHIPPEQFPGQALVVRPLPARRHPRGRDRQRDVRPGRSRHRRVGRTRRWNWCAWPIPRRVYTQSHIDYVDRGRRSRSSDSRDTLRGLRIVEAPPALRHFTAKFEEV